MSELLVCSFMAALLEWSTKIRAAVLRSLEQFLSEPKDQALAPKAPRDSSRALQSENPFTWEEINDAHHLPGCSLPLSESFAFFVTPSADMLPVPCQSGSNDETRAL